MDPGAALGPLKLLARVTRALDGDRDLAERLDDTIALLSPELADRARIRRAGGEAAPGASGGSHRLSLPLLARGLELGRLELERDATRPDWTAIEQLIAGEVAARVAAAIDTSDRLADAAMNEEFLATLSHELRTPLNVVVGWVELLRSGQLDDEKRRRALELIDRNARVQVRLVEDLLDASRIVAGRLEVAPADVELGEALSACIEAMRPYAEEAGVELVVEPPPSLQVLADPVRLNQMVQNLVGNAIKFTARDGRVTVSATSEGDFVAIAVSDTGAGIEPELLPRLFDRFWQGDRRRLDRTRGLGLGLFITRNLAELQGGEIAAASDGPGQGSRFTIRLPLGSAASRS